MLLDRHRLAAQEAAPEGVALVPHVHRRDVGELVVGQREEALARREGLHRLRQRRDVEQDGVVGRRARGGVAVVAEILEQHRGPVPRLPVEHLLVEARSHFRPTGRCRASGRSGPGRNRASEKFLVSSVDRSIPEASRGTCSGSLRLVALGIGFGRLRGDRFLLDQVVVLGGGGSGSGACWAYAAVAALLSSAATHPLITRRHRRRSPFIAPLRRYALVSRAPLYVPSHWPAPPGRTPGSAATPRTPGCASTR